MIPPKEIIDIDGGHESMNTCIWCANPTHDFEDEHIIPDALGCPRELVLRSGEVCRSCNNRLAHLDQAVADEFDMIAFSENIPRKGGRSPVIRGRGNVVGTHAPSGPVLTWSMEKHSVRAFDGTKIGGYGKSARNIKARFKRENTPGRNARSGISQRSKRHLPPDLFV